MPTPPNRFDSNRRLISTQSASAKVFSRKNMSIKGFSNTAVGHNLTPYPTPGPSPSPTPTPTETPTPTPASNCNIVTKAGDNIVTKTSDQIVIANCI